jgi:hypothetical protein
MRLFLTSLLSACALNVSAHDYSTLETVKFVSNCMLENGGQSQETLYTCVCRFDYIAGQMPFAEFEMGIMSERFRDLGGKRGGLVRDTEETRHHGRELAKLRKSAVEQCPLTRHISSESAPKSE